jgi:hypothetical protein
MLADEQLLLLNNLSSTQMAGALLFGAAIGPNKALSRYERELNVQKLPIMFHRHDERERGKTAQKYCFQFF